MGDLRGGTTIGGFVATHFGNFVTMLKSLTSIRLSGKISGSGTFDENGVLSINTTSNITKADVGLGSVLNYGVATTAEAQAGTSDSKYMTPLRVKEAVAANVKIAHGTYTGNDSQGRNITVGFTPKKVWINNNLFGEHCFLGEYSWVNVSNGSSVEETKLITTSGFTLSTAKANERLNFNSKTYYWTAIG